MWPSFPSTHPPLGALMQCLRGRWFGSSGDVGRGWIDCGVNEKIWLEMKPHNCCFRRHGRERERVQGELQYHALPFLIISVNKWLKSTLITLHRLISAWLIGCMRRQTHRSRGQRGLWVSHTLGIHVTCVDKTIERIRKKRWIYFASLQAVDNQVITMKSAGTL